MKNNTATLTTSDNTDSSSSYKPSITFYLPSNGTVPVHFEAAGEDLEKITGLLAKLNTYVAGTVDYLSSEATWANETASLLENLRSVTIPLISALNSVKLNPLQIVANPVERFEKYNQYFHIIECSDMDLLQLLKGDVDLLQSILLEIQLIRMDEHEIINILKAVTVRYETYLNIFGYETNPDNFSVQYIKSSFIDPILYDCRISSAFYRWFACHWDFGINLIHARYHLDAAANSFTKGNHQGTAKAIVKAGILLRGSSADMVFGSNMPAKTYQEFIRPSMGDGFTGNDNHPWAIFAAAKKALMAMPGIKCNQTINTAWSSFLEKYLQDIEIHTTIADKLVGEKPSLIIDELNHGIPEEEKDKTSATSGLRNLHYGRLAEFSFLNSYPILFTLFKPKSNENG